VADGTENEPDGPKAVVVAWCKGCHHATASVTCEKCAVPKAACANCGRCPSCDGPIDG